MPPRDQRDFDVVVVDDGSTDDTAEQIARFDFPVIRHEKNRGLGAAIKSGMRYALDHDYDILCILAGNAKDDSERDPPPAGPHPQPARPTTCRARASPPAAPTSTPPPSASSWSRCTPASSACSPASAAPTTLNGFRAYRTSLLRAGSRARTPPTAPIENRINVWQDWLDGYELETYLHYNVLKSGRPVTEVGVSKTYPEKAAKLKYSHIRPVRDWWRILRPLPLLMLGIKK